MFGMSSFESLPATKSAPPDPANEPSSSGSTHPSQVSQKAVDIYQTSDPSGSRWPSPLTVPNQVTPPQPGEIYAKRFADGEGLFAHIGMPEADQFSQCIGQWRWDPSFWALGEYLTLSNESHTCKRDLGKLTQVAQSLPKDLEDGCGDYANNPLFQGDQLGSRVLGKLKKLSDKLTDQWKEWCGVIAVMEDIETASYGDKVPTSAMARQWLNSLKNAERKQKTLTKDKSFQEFLAEMNEIVVLCERCNPPVDTPEPKDPEALQNLIDAAQKVIASAEGKSEESYLLSLAKHFHTHWTAKLVALPDVKGKGPMFGPV